MDISLESLEEAVSIRRKIETLEKRLDAILQGSPSTSSPAPRKPSTKELARLTPARSSVKLGRPQSPRSMRRFVMSVDQSASDASRRMRTYKRPPSDFDPRTASDAVLVRHGLPRRPSAGGEPGLARIWERLFARPVTF